MAIYLEDFAQHSHRDVVGGYATATRSCGISTALSLSNILHTAQVSVAMNSSSFDGNVTTNSSTGSNEIAAGKITTTDLGDLCTWYSGATCSRPRSCYDCLNVVIPGHECVIGPYGACVNTSAVGTYPGFSMDNYTYCSESDATCSSRRSNWIDEYGVGFVDRRDRCFGEDGCICIASCELPDHDNNVIQDSTSCIPALNGSQLGVILGVVGGCIAVILLGLIFVMWRRRRQRRPQQLQVEREVRGEVLPPSASAHLPQLSLSGWTDMRDAKTTTLPRKPMTTPATTEGDEYRPMSPNQQQSQAQNLRRS